MNQKTSETEPRLHASDAIASPAVAEEEGIAVQGARVHNLKNISVTIPKTGWW